MGRDGLHIAQDRLQRIVIVYDAGPGQFDQPFNTLANQIRRERHVAAVAHPVLDRNGLAGVQQRHALIPAGTHDQAAEIDFCASLG